MDDVREAKLSLSPSDFAAFREKVEAETDCDQLDGWLDDEEDWSANY